MKIEVADSVLDYIFGLFDDTLYYSGELFPVRTIADKKDRRYVLLNAPTYSDDPVYGTRDYECTLQVEVNDFFDNRGSLKGVNEVGRQIIDVLDRQLWALEGYTIISGPFIFDSRLNFFDTEVGTLIKKTIIFTFKIQED